MFDRTLYFITWAICCTGMTFCPACRAAGDVPIKAGLLAAECVAGGCVFWTEATIKLEYWDLQTKHKELDDTLYCKQCENDGCQC